MQIAEGAIISSCKETRKKAHVGMRWIGLQRPALQKARKAGADCLTWKWLSPPLIDH